MSRAKATPAEAWAHWRGVLEQFGAIAATVENTGGEEVTFEPTLKRAFYDLRDVPFPVDGRGPEQMAEAFRLQAQALIDVALPPRRVACAIGIGGSARALEFMWHAEQARLTQIQLTRHGAGD